MSDSPLLRFVMRRAPCLAGLVLLGVVIVAAMLLEGPVRWGMGVVGLGLLALCHALRKVSAARDELAAEAAERRRMEKELREREARYRAMCQGFPEGVLMPFDDRGCIVAVEGAGLPGLAAVRDLVDKQPRDAFEGDMGSRIQEAVERALQGAESRFDLTYWGRLVQVHVHPVGDGNTSTRGVVAARDVTEQRSSENALAENERRLSTLISNMPGMVYRCVYSRNRTMEFVSEGCRELTGHDPEDLVLNRRVAWFELVHPDDRQGLQDLVYEAVADGRPFTATYRIRTARGEEKWVWERGAAVCVEEGGFTVLEGLVLDDTQRVTAVRRLEEAYAELDQIFNSTGNGMYLMDLDMRYVRVNRAFADMFSLDPEGLVGKACGEELEGRSVCPLPCPSGSPPLPGESVSTRAEMEGENGSRHFEITTSSLSNPSGHSVGFVVTVQETTGKVLAERAAKAREQQLIQADKLAALGTLVAGVAHEINNPNTVISLNAPLMRQAWADARKVLDEHYGKHGEFPLAGGDYSVMRWEVDPMLGKIVESSRRIRSIVADLKGFARTPAPGRKEVVSLHRLLRTVVRLVESKLSKCTRDFRLELPDTPVKVLGDFQRLEQVVVNLLINACEALDSQDQAIRAQVSVAHGQWAEIVVRDGGKGMDAEQLAHARDPFYTTKQEEGGTGLGLSISHSIVEDHGGSMEFTSEPGRGTVCRVRLPLAEEGAGTSPPGTATQ